LEQIIFLEILDQVHQGTPMKSDHISPSEKTVDFQNRFKSHFPDFKNFEDPGEALNKAELGYKRDLLGRFQKGMSAAELKQALDEGRGRDVLIHMQRCSGNLSHFTSWDRTFGKDDETRTATLSVLYEVTREPWKGKETLAPLFRTFRLHNCRPSWDALSVALWQFRPEEYFPLKINAFRKFAHDELHTELPLGLPTAESYASLLEFVQAFSPCIKDWKPADTIDLQSFVYVLAVYTQQKIASPLNDVLDSREQAHQVFTLFKQACDLLELTAEGPGALLAAMTMPRTSGGRCIRLNYGRWAAISFYGQGFQQPHFEIVCCPDAVPECAYLFDGNQLVPSHLCDDGRAPDQMKWCRILLSDMKQAEVITSLRESMLWLKNRFGSMKASPYSHYHIPDLYAAVYDADTLDRILNTGITEPENETGNLPSWDETGLLQCEKCTVEEAMGDLFMPVEAFREIVINLRRRKNLILQGAPGTGKTYAARRIAYALMEEKDPSRIQMIQFHQSYGYEDFIQGWRPNETGGFELHDGHFKRFCEKARNDQTRPYVFIIDEINRGNLSRIFGEIMVLLESDKRGMGMPLTYSPDETFMVPPNVYLLGLMNTADRSLAVVDYALRRRFAFTTLLPCYDTPAFAAFLESKNVSRNTSRLIHIRMDALNHRIAKDTERLGPGCQIGHSFFVPSEPVADEQRWYQDVIRWEILPLLDEYWMDEPTQVEDLRRELLP
jgi:hypothetical protein